MNEHQTRALGADYDIFLELVRAKYPRSLAIINGSSIGSKDVFNLVSMRN